jgi:uncharacterized repeat protein (TIGR02543 family)
VINLPKKRRRFRLKNSLSKVLATSVFITILIETPANAVTLIPCSVSGSMQVSGTTVIDSPGCVGSVEVPSYITTIGPDAFNGVTGLTDLTFARGSALTSIGSSAFAYTDTMTITLPQGLASIGDSAFYASRIYKIVIPASVTSIGIETFRQASLRGGVYFMGNAPSVGGLTFYAVSPFARAKTRTGATGFGIGVSSTWSQLSLDSPGRSVTYRDNSSSAGVSPSDQTPIYLEGSQATVLGNTRDLSRNGYSFGGWSTNTQGTGTIYQQGDLITIYDQDIVFYPKWNPQTYVVNFNSVSGSAVSDGSFITNGSISSPTSPSRPGYTFAGWSATDGGALIDFPYSPNVFSNVTLYAKWNPIPAPIVEVVNNQTPAEDSSALEAARELASRTIGINENWGTKNLAFRTGVKIVEPKASVSITIAKSSKKVCKKSGSKLKTLKPGTCLVTFTVQEPKPKKGKKPKATKTVKTLVVQ